MKEQGFTLIELLTTLSIIGILSAIASQQFAGYRSSAFDAKAQSDLRHVIMAEEAHFISTENYVACDQSNCATLLPALRALSDGVVLEVTTSGNTFAITSTHPSGTGQVFSYAGG